MGAPISLDGVAVHPDCWCVCLCYYLHLHQKIQKMAMYLLVPAHPGCPRQSPESCKMVVCMCVCVCVCVRACMRACLRVVFIFISVWFDALIVLHWEYVSDVNSLFHCANYIVLYGMFPAFYTSAHGSGRRYYILPLKFLSFFSFFFFRHRISEMALPTGNLSSSDGRI